MRPSSRTRDEALRTSRLEGRETVEIEPSDDRQYFENFVLAPDF